MSPWAPLVGNVRAHGCEYWHAAAFWQSHSTASKVVALSIPDLTEGLVLSRKVARPVPGKGGAEDEPRRVFHGLGVAGQGAPEPLVAKELLMGIFLSERSHEAGPGALAARTAHVAEEGALRFRAFLRGVHIVFCAVTGLLFLFGSKALGGDFLRYDRDISGTVIDYETREPVEGVVVSAVWFTEHTRITIGPERRYYDSAEVLTDRNGTFRIPGKGLNILRRMPPPTVALFKAGYSGMHLMDLGPHFRMDHPRREDVRWVNGRPVIAVRKASVEERKRYLRTHGGVPFPGMAVAGVPREKVRLFQREIAREHAALGMTPPGRDGPPLLRFKEGGVFPAGSTGNSPKTAP